MTRKNRRKVDAIQPLPAVELVGPTPEQMRHADYERGEVMHVETFTRATAHRIRRESSLAVLRDHGRISPAQYIAALDIARVAEHLQRTVEVRCASLEARVDNQGSDRSVLIENMTLAKLEVVYTRWRTRLPMPRRMIVDMVTNDRSLKATARVYRMGYPKALSRLRDALDLWADLREKVWREIDEVDLLRAQARAVA